MVKTVPQNYEGYTKQEVERAIGIRPLQCMLGNPCHRDLLAMAFAEMITNCPFNAEDCKHASKIFGKNLPDILGKTVRKRPEHVEPEDSDVPANLIKDNSSVTLTGNIMFVNQVPFLVTSACPAKAIANNLSKVIHL